MRAALRRIADFGRNRKACLYYAACVVLLVAAAGLRFHDLSEKTVSHDEAVAANNSRDSLSEVVSNTRCCNSSPILYPLVLYGVQKVEISPFSVRVAPALTGVLTVAALLFLLPRAGVSRRTAFLAALPATLSIAAIRNAQGAREYSVDALLAVLLIAGLLWYLRDGRKALLCVALFLAPLLQYGLVLFGAAVMGAAMLLPPPPTLAAPEGNAYPSRLRNWLKPRIALAWPAGCFLAGCAISYAVTLRYQWEEGGYGSQDYLGSVGYLSAYYYQGNFDAHSIFEFSIDGIWSLLTYHLPEVVAIAALAAFAFLPVVTFLRKFQVKFPERAIAVLFSFCIAISVGAALLGIYPLGGIYQNIYLGPIVFLAVGVAFHCTVGYLTALTRRWGAAPAAAVAGAVALAGVGDLWRDMPYETDHTANVVLAFLEENVAEGDMVYVSDYATPLIKFYQDEKKSSSYHYAEVGCRRDFGNCLNEMLGLVLSLPNVPNRIFLVQRSKFIPKTASGGEAGINYANEAKRVGETITAYLVSDGYGPWRWQRADARSGDVNTPDDATWSNIEGARSFSYTPASEDEGKFLRAYVSYEKKGVTHRVQTEAVGPIEGLALLGEQVSVESVITDGDFNISLIGLNTSFIARGRRAFQSAYEALVAGEPVIRSDFDIYLSEDSLTYVKEPCAPADTEAMFFLHLYPVDGNDLPHGRRPYGFDNLDFDFYGRGMVLDGRCMARIPLPEYAIARIGTGQYVSVLGGFHNFWEVEMRLDDGVALIVNAKESKKSLEAALRSDYETLVSGEPVMRSDFDIYLSENKLTYVKEPCASADTEAKFFLALHPADANDLPDRRRRYGFDNLDFDFDERGVISDGKCVARIPLPGYAIAGIGTGQYIPAEGGFKHLWEEEIRLEE